MDIPCSVSVDRPDSTGARDAWRHRVEAPTRRLPSPGTQPGRGRTRATATRTWDHAAGGGDTPRPVGGSAEAPDTAYPTRQHRSHRTEPGQRMRSSSVTPSPAPTGGADGFSHRQIL